MSNDSRNKRTEKTKFYVITNLEQEAIQFEEVILLMSNKLSHILLSIFLLVVYLLKSNTSEDSQMCHSIERHSQIFSPKKG